MEKNVLLPVHIITGGDASGNLTSTSTHIQWLDNISISATFTGSPVGTLAVQGSLDNSTFVTLPGTSTSISASGTTLFDLNQLSFPYVQLIYTASSGTGTLNALISGKEV